MAGFFGLKVSHIINLMEPREKDLSGKPFPEYSSNLYFMAKGLNASIKISRKPIPSGKVPSRGTIKGILDKLDMVINRGRLVYLHSRNGRGRTGMVIGCYFVRHGMSGDEALEWIRILRMTKPTGHLPSPESKVQRKMVLNWKE